MKPPVLAIVGWSGSGKTTLLAWLLPRLTAAGLRVNVVKHSHHLPDADASGKDSERLLACGATSVTLAYPFAPYTTPALGMRSAPALAAVLARLPAADLVLVEGYKNEQVDKIEVFRPSLGKPPLYPHDVHIHAVASDAMRPEPAGQRCWLDLNQRQEILCWLLETCQLAMPPGYFPYTCLMEQGDNRTRHRH